MDQICEYKVFIDKGKFSVSKIPWVFSPLRTHLVYDVKHNGWYKARLVANGNLTKVPIDSVYSGVVSLRGFCMCLFIAELNGLQLYATDIRDAYLEGFTSKRLYVKAGKEFGDQEGHLLIVSRSLYGLRTSGVRWSETLRQCLTKLGFERSKCEDDIWIRDEGIIMS